MGREKKFNIYDDVTKMTWRAGFDPTNEAERFHVFLNACMKQPPLPIKRVSGQEIDAMGLRSFVTDGKVDFDAVNSYRAARGLNEIRLGVHLDDNA